MIDINIILNAPKPDLGQIPITDWFDNSRLEGFQRCNRWQWYTDILQLDSGSAPMYAGTVFHKGIEELSKDGNVDRAGVQLVREWEQYKGSFNGESSRFNRQTMYDVFLSYAEKWKNDKLEYLALEVPLAWFDPVLKVWFVGKCDGLIWYMGKLWLIERKTTGSLRPDFLGSLSVGTQKFQYLFILGKVLEDAGFNVQETLGGLMFDCIGWSATKTEFARWTVKLPNHAQFDEWYSDAERTIWDTQVAYKEVGEKNVLPRKRRGQCYTYGKCSFLDLCGAYEVQTGLNTPAIVANFRRKTWRPI